MNLNNSVAIVTGAGRGIGRAIALALAENGANVVVSSRTQKEIDAAKEKIIALGRKSIAIRGDVAKEVDVKNVISQTVSEFGKIDILINNAGIGAFAPVTELKTEDFDNMWATNMRGVFLFSKYVIPHMAKQKSGNIVNISSLAGRNAFKGGAGYSATKWALIGFSRTLMLEVREHNIRVITLCPGSVDTDFSPSQKNPKESSRIPKAEDIAKIVVNTLQMPDNVLVSEIDIRPTNPNW